LKSLEGGGPLTARSGEIVKFERISVLERARQDSETTDCTKWAKTIGARIFNDLLGSQLHTTQFARVVRKASLDVANVMNERLGGATKLSPSDGRIGYE
jgi:hypothetical protein